MNTTTPKISKDQANRRFVVLVVFGFFTTIGLLHFCYRYFDDLTRSIPGTLGPRFIEEMTGAYSAALLFPVILWAARRFRINRSNLVRTLSGHLLVVLAVSAGHTSLMAVTRQVIFRLAGLGTYDYGIMSLRYLMEFPNDFIWYGFLVAFIHLFDRYRELREQETKAAQLETQLAQAQLQALQFQIQPHFLFNTLNTISAVLYEDLHAADRMITRLSDFLRATLNTANQQEVTLAEELRYAQLYLEIMKSRFENSLTVDFSIEPEVQNALVPRFLLQPLVENAIKYAVNPQSGKIRIEVWAQRREEWLEIEVRDDGPGIHPQETGENPTKIGLANIRERLTFLYGEHYSFTFRNLPQGGLATCIAIPMQLAASGEPANVASAVAYR